MIAKIYLYSVSSSESSPSPSLWFSNFVKKNVFFLIVHFFYTVSKSGRTILITCLGLSVCYGLNKSPFKKIRSGIGEMFV